MAKEIDFALLAETENTSRHWPRRDANPTVQMSLRMPVETYERFRTLCKQERRTNGDMLRVLMEGYFAREESQGRRSGPAK